MRIAVDVGFGFVKAMNEHEKTVLFPTVISRRNQQALKGVMGGVEDDYVITYFQNSDMENGQDYYVGDASITNGGERMWEDKSAFNAHDIHVFIATAIAVLNPQGNPVDLVVGLPITHYFEKKDKLIETLFNVNDKLTLGRNQSPIDIHIQSVICFPQGAGAYYASTLDINGQVVDFSVANSNIGVIDIGYRTVDFLVMKKGRKGVNLAENLSGSLEEDGMNKAFQMIEKNVSEDNNREIRLMEIEKALLWFDGTINFQGTQIHLERYEQEAYQALAEKIISNIKIKWGAEIDFLDKIFITGGGGEALFQEIQKGIKGQIELQDHAEYGNCRGYLAVQAAKNKKRID